MYSLKVIIFILILPMLVLSKELSEYNQSIRSLGMGGVYLPFVKDHDALLYNPAALSRVEGINWAIIDVSAGLNGLQIANDLSSMGSVDGVAGFSNLYGKNIWLGLGAKSIIYLPNFAFGIYDAGHAGLYLTNPAFPEFNVSYINDLGYALGGSVSFSQVVSMGLAIRRVTRTGGEAAVGAATIAQGSSDAISAQFNNQGMGYGIDWGMNFYIPAPMSPTISIAWKDIGKTTFTAITDSGPDKQQDNLAMGFGFGFDLPGLDLNVGLEARHLTMQSEPLGKKLHFGLEFGIPFLDFRTGFYQGYPTYGLTFDLFLLKFDVAMYSVEKGVYPGQTPDARIQAALILDIGFDPSFNLDLSGKGGKRKLKHRR